MEEALSEIVQCYQKDDIWNMDETGLFWRALPDKVFGRKSKHCKRGENMKQRLIIAFFVTATGKREKPIVTWKSENPRCLCRFEKSLLPVTYFSEPKAWMTGDILETILSKLNRQMINKNRNILLFMDNAGCHPEELCTKFSNIQICSCLPTLPHLATLSLGCHQ